MIIRRATELDLHNLGRLWLKMIREITPDNNPNVDWWRAENLMAMQSGGYFTFVAEEGGALVGFTSFSIQPDPASGQVQAIGRHIYVLPEYRKGKVGAQLHKENLRLAREQGAAAWVLLCTDKEKPLWMKKGFEPVRTVLIKRLEA